MKSVVLVIVLFFSLNCNAQDINFGANIGINPYNRLKFENATGNYKTPNGFATYVPPSSSKLIFDEHKFLNTVHFGASLRFSRKKIGLNIEPQALFEYIQFGFDSPYPEHKRILSRRGLRLPVYLTYHLFNNPRSVHFNAGIILNSMQFFDYQRPEIGFYTGTDSAFTGSETNYGDNHFYTVFYNDKKINFDLMLGVGKRIKKLDYNLRYVTALDPSSILGVRWQLEFHINFFFLSKAEFTTKNYLYEE